MSERIATQKRLIGEERALIDDLRRDIQLMQDELAYNVQNNRKRTLDLMISIASTKSQINMREREVLIYQRSIVRIREEQADA